MKKVFGIFLKLCLVLSIFVVVIYYSISVSIDNGVVRESIKSELLSGFIYEDDGSKTEIFNTIVRLTKLDENTVIKIMENDKANEIITDIVDSVYDYNLTGDSSYKYTSDDIVNIVSDNIDQVLMEVDYNISRSDKEKAIDYTRDNAKDILDIIYSTDIGGYSK